MWPLSSDECYVSIDIEADGPVPGLHSMLSLGAAAFTSDGRLLDTFSANLEPLPEASEDPRTMRWWASQGAAWEACHIDPRPPAEAMMPRHWRPRTPHTHVAVDDAIEQGELFLAIVRELNAQRGDIAVPTPRAARRRERLERRRRRRSD